MTAAPDTTAAKARIERLYRTLAPRLLNFLVANGTAHALACDIVQETFLRLWKMRDDLDAREDQVSGLAYTIARNLRTDAFRKACRETPQDDIAAVSDAVTGGQGVRTAAPDASDTAYLRQRLVSALAQVPPLLREAYTLFQIQELSVREIARRTHASESLVKVRVFRAKEKLRPLLKDLL